MWRSDGLMMMMIVVACRLSTYMSVFVLGDARWNVRPSLCQEGTTSNTPHHLHSRCIPKWQTITQMLINQFSVFANDIYLGTEQTLDANQNSVRRKLKHRQYLATHTLSRAHAAATATTQRNQKFENNNEMFVMSDDAIVHGEQRKQRERRRRGPQPLPLNHNNDVDDVGHQRRNRTFSNAPSLLGNRQRWHHLQHQQNIISKNIIIETGRKLFAGKNVSTNAIWE